MGWALDVTHRLPPFLPEGGIVRIFLPMFFLSTLACSGAKPEDNAPESETPQVPAPPTPSSGTYFEDSKALNNAHSLEVVVTWNDIPASVMRSPGLDSCGNDAPAPVPFYIREKKRTVNALLSTLIRIDGIEKGSPIEELSPAIQIRDCTISPRIAVASAKSTANFTIVNLDEKPHTLVVEKITEQEAETVLKTRLAVVGQRAKIQLDSYGLYRVRMDALPYGDVYIFKPQHPYVAIPDENGVATFNQVPKGDYTIRAWHPPVTPGGPSLRVKKPTTINSESRARLEIPIEAKN